MGAEIRWGMWAHSRSIRRTGWVAAALWLLALPAVAQLQVGEFLKMNLSGNIGATYSASNDQGTSSHGMGFSGNGILSGNYYNPNFLNFNVSPTYNRNQDNNLFGTVTNTRGVTSGVNLFTGSHFPGSFTYSRMSNGSSEFGVPGSDLGLAQHGNNQAFGVGWSVLIPDYPTLTATYGINDSTESLFGAPGSDSENDHTLNLSSAYKIDGWRMTGQFEHRNTEAHLAEALSTGGGEPVTSTSSSNDYGATAQHSLPWAGDFGVSFNHLGYGYHYEDSYTNSNSGGSYTLNSNAAFHPIQKVGVGFNANYTDSLLGNIPAPALNSGAELNLQSLGSFHSFRAGTDVYYQILKNLGIHADVEHEQESFLGQSYSATQFGGSAIFNFDHSLLKGLSFSVGVVDTAQQQENTGLGFVGNLNYNRKFYGWDVGGNFSYAQNVQTVALVYTTSSYSYLASIRKRIGERTHFLLGYSGSHSGITANSGTTSSAERVYTTFLHRGYNLSVYYSKSNGLAILTANGLVPVTTTLPPQLLGEPGFTSYKSEGWGVNAGGTLFRRLTLTGAYGKSNGNTITPTLATYNDNTLINATMQYRLRKIFLIGGYTRLEQSVGTFGSAPIEVTSYFIGFSRWFNFF